MLRDDFSLMSCFIMSCGVQISEAIIFSFWKVANLVSLFQRKLATLRLHILPFPLYAGHSRQSPWEDSPVTSYRCHFFYGLPFTPVSRLQVWSHDHWRHVGGSCGFVENYCHRYIYLTSVHIKALYYYYINIQDRSYK